MTSAPTGSLALAQRTESPHETMVTRFASLAADRPDAIAWRYQGNHQSFAELDLASDRIARWLVEHGVLPDSVVASRVPRGPLLLATLLGIMKSGAAYLPLEPNMPMARQNLMLRRCGVATAVVADDDEVAGEVAATLRLGHGEPSSECVVELPRVHPESLAYVNYTSGSTGEPKPVGVPHRAVVHLADSGFVDVRPDDVFLCMSSLAFDATTFELWCSLLNGASVALQPPGRMVADDLIRTLEHEKVTVAWFTSGIFDRLCHYHLDDLAGLRWVVTGGDVVSTRSAERFRTRHPGTTLANGYGPTENTTFSTLHVIDEASTRDVVPIGRALAGKSAHVVDPDAASSPVGEEGELWLGGPGVARGYLGRPRDTALRFVPDPAGDGTRVYRSGDLADVDETGIIRFHGRRDRQVKIRGYRVELEEIERVLAGVDGVAQCAASTEVAPGGDRRIVAFLVPENDDEGDSVLSSRARRVLRASLPEPMMPSILVVLPDMPLTDSGKVAYARLSSPPRASRPEDLPYRAPSTATTQLLCEMWGEALGIEPIGELDDFFELGGNSLLAMDFIRRLDETLDVQIPVRTLLYNPVVESFAIEVDRLLEDG